MNPEDLFVDDTGKEESIAAVVEVAVLQGDEDIPVGGGGAGGGDGGAVHKFNGAGWGKDYFEQTNIK